MENVRQFTALHANDDTRFESSAWQLNCSIRIASIVEFHLWLQTLSELIVQLIGFC